jgi:DNA polymerase-3 subunit delta'
VRIIDDEGSSIKIDQIRDLQRESSLSPFEGRWRVYILCNFQKATLEAANCLLKTLEEPSPRVVLVLTATEPELLLPTIISRCQVLNLRPFAVAAVEQALRDHWGVELRQAQLLARLCDGRLGWAVQAIRDDTLLRQREKYFLALEQALQQERIARMGLAQQLCQDPLVLPKVFELWQSWWRDLLLAKSGNRHRMTNVDREQTLLHEAQQYTLVDIVGCLRAIRRSAQQVEQNVNACLALELLLLGLPRPKDGGTMPRPKDGGGYHHPTQNRS